MTLPIGRFQIVEANGDIQIFCQAIGELVLLASEIDAQLTKAVIFACLLKETPMLQSIIAELDARTKIEILRNFFLALPSSAKATEWAKHITKWLDKAETANRTRNTVAHHGVRMSDGRLILHSEQARKLLKKIKKSRHIPNKTVDDTHMSVNDIKQWVKEAKNVYVEGQNVLSNLDQFAKKATKHKAKKITR